MAIAGALAGMSGVAQVAGTEKVLTDGVAATYGFDAITVALLGRSTPWGTFAAGLLFGAFRAGAVQMQIQTGTPIDIVLVVQSLIVLFIAAPPLVRAVFGLNPRRKKPAKTGKTSRQQPPEAQHERNSNIAPAGTRNARNIAPGRRGPANIRQTGALENPVLLSALGVVAFVFFGLMGSAQTARFGISTGGDFFQLPTLEIPAMPGGIVLSVLMLGLAAYAVYLKTKARPTPAWLTVTFTVLFVAAFLIWVVGGARTPSISLAGLIAGSVTLAVPLVFGSLSGVLCERVGVVNIAIEGQLLGGAFTAAIVASITQNPFVGLLAAAVAGAAVSMVLAVFSIRYLVNQIIVGVVLNVLISGVTGFLFSTVMQADKAKFNSPPGLDIVQIPILSGIPILGPSCSSSRWWAT
ncbi:uncharacterized ABC transporter permease protein YufP [Arthrobacter sp. Hiyo4]|nr:uncharacterized ABC transporter permease protein YufP [Arthrobacter sp. Hiyo4]